MPAVQPYLNFDGNCADALHFYEKVLGAKIDAIMKFGQSPMAGQTAPEDAERVMHARFTIDGNVLMASDATCAMPSQGRHGFALSLSYPTAEEAHRVFGELTEGGKVEMPIGKTFWADAFGMGYDRFGTPWMVNGGMQPMQ